MRKSLVYFIDIPFEKRLEYIVETYGKLDQKELSAATIRIQKKLGGVETKTAIDYLDNDDLKSCFNILLKYYDKLYLKSLKLRANTKNEGSDNDSKEDLVQKDNMIEQNQSKAYLENYKIEICSDIVDSKINSQKLLTAFYGRN
jgi:hypothetical protein